jgi:hypothetical protein
MVESKKGTMSEVVTVRVVLTHGERRFELPPGAHVVGRSSECSIRLNDANVSRKHVRFKVHEDRASIEDLASKNGTRVNGMPVVRKEVALAHGDEILLGRLMLSIAIQPESSFYEEDTITVTGDGPAPILDWNEELNACPSCDVVIVEEADHCPHCGCQLQAGRTTCFTQELPLFDPE